MPIYLQTYCFVRLRNRVWMAVSHLAMTERSDHQAGAWGTLPLAQRSADDRLAQRRLADLTGETR